MNDLSIIFTIPEEIASHLNDISIKISVFGGSDY